MKAIKATGSINEQGQIQLDRPLTSDVDRRVEVIILFSEDLDLEVDGESQEEILSDLRQAHQEIASEKIDS